MSIDPRLPIVEKEVRCGRHLEAESRNVLSDRGRVLNRSCALACGGALTNRPVQMYWPFNLSVASIDPLFRECRRRILLIA